MSKSFEPVHVGPNGRRLGPFREEWTVKEAVNVVLDVGSPFVGVGIVTSAIGAVFNASYYIETHEIDK